MIIIGALSGWYLFQRLTAGNAYAKNDQQNSDKESPFYFPIFNTEAKTLRYFKEEEFRDWWPDMSTELLEKLDEFRHRLGVPVHISPKSGSLGRHLGLTRTSQHNIDMWGEVRAADVMFTGVSLEDAYQIAKEVGFTGIGAYPDWKPSQGMHLDVRQAPLALWSGVLEGGKQVYKGIKTAFA